MYARTYARQAMGGVRARRRPVAPALFGGPRGGRKPIYLQHDDGLGLFSGDLPYGPAANYGSDSVEAWRPLVEANAGSNPVEFLLAWIAVESAGNPCSWTSLSEAGIFQLMAGDNIANGQTSIAEQHPVPPCVSNQQTSSSFSALTSDQATAQVQGGINYVNWCVGYANGALLANGYSWDQSSMDFWIATKMSHVAPGALSALLAAAVSQGSAPSTWDDTVTAASAAGTTYPANWIQNAQVVGQYGAGGGSLLGGLGGLGLPLVAAIGIATWYVLSS
jgi:hypothetical protein